MSDTLFYGKTRMIIYFTILFSNIIAIWLLLGLTMEFAVYAVLISFTLLLAFHDVFTFRLPDKIVAVMAIFAATVLPFNPFTTLLLSILGAVLVGGLLLAASAVTKGQIGMGDGKLLAVIGLLVGLKASFMILMYALIFSGLVGLAMIVLRKADKKTSIPFAPFVLCGIWAELFLKF